MINKLFKKICLVSLTGGLLTINLSACTQEELINRAASAAIGAGVGLLQAAQISTETEIQMGAEMREEVLKEYKLYTGSSKLVDYVRGIGEKIARNAKRNSELDYRFDIVESKEINAFTIPGGSVFVTTELLKYLHNEAELAAVLGHEIGHNEQKHAVDSIRRVMVAQGVLEGGLKQDSQLIQTVGSIALDLILKGFDRNQEIEADQTGTLLATQASYGEDSLEGFFNTLLQITGGDPNLFVQFLLTHPATEDRIRLLEEFNQQHKINVTNPLINEKVYQEMIAVLPPKVTRNSPATR